MKLQPITLHEDKEKKIYATPDCQQLLAIYEDYYKKIGFRRPWIGYFIARKNTIVGCCGFVEQPKEGKVEIAYGTFKPFEGKGIASFACGELIAIAYQENPLLTIVAKTAPEHNASAKILKNNNFVFTTIVQDHEIGDAWLWTHQKQPFHINNTETLQ